MLLRLPILADEDNWPCGADPEHRHVSIHIVILRWADHSG